MDEMKEVSTRTTTILTIEALEQLTPGEEGVELNEGYQYEVKGSIPQLADAIAKLAHEMDKDKDMGTKGGGAFLALIAQYYKTLDEGGTQNETARL